MTHVVKPLTGPVGTARQPLAGSNANAGIDLLNGKYHNRRSPTNIKTNPNYSARQQRPSPNPSTGSETEEYSRKGNRPRSMVILGTSGNSNTRSRKRSKDKDKGQVHPKTVSNPDVRQRSRGLSNPDIGESLKHDLSGGNVRPPYRPRGGSESNILDDKDLDRPEYDRGLSSPDLGQGQARKLKQTKNSASLDFLQRSHDCLRTGLNGTCKCTVKFYRSQSFGADKKGVPRTMSGIIPRMVGNNSGAGSSGQAKDRTISDSDVSAFFKPSPTVWDLPAGGIGHPQQGKMGRPHSVDAVSSRGNNTANAPSTASLRASFFRPKAQDEPVKQWPLRPMKAFGKTGAAKDVTEKVVGIDSSVQPQAKANGTGKTAIEPMNITVRRSSSLPAPRTWDRNASGSVMNCLPATVQVTPPLKPPRTALNDINQGTSFIQAESEQVISKIPGSTTVKEGKIESGMEQKKADRTMLPSNSTNGPSAVAPPTPSSSNSSSSPSKPASSLASTVNQDYKPLYSKLVTPSNRWYTPYASSTSTYFAPKESVLPRNSSTYGYSSKEDKAKVLALLDRYASSGRSNLGLTRTEMTNYLNSTKQQLGLKKPQHNLNNPHETENNALGSHACGKGTFDDGYKTDETKVSSDKPEHVDISDENSVMKELSPGSVDEKENIQPVADKTNVKTKEMNRISRWRNTNELHAISFPNKSNRMPSMITTFGDKVETIEKKSFEPRSTVSKDFRAIPSGEETNKTISIAQKRDCGSGGLTQTTFHVDGAVTESPAVRRRTVTQCNSRPEQPDDVNNNDDKISGSMDGSHESTPCQNEDSEEGANDPVYSVKIPGHYMWRFGGASPLNNNNVPTQLQYTGITETDFGDGLKLLDECTRHKQLLETLNTWLFGSYLALFFVIIWLVGFLVCYCLGIVPKLSAGLLFLVAIFLISGAALAIQHMKFKVTPKLQNALMKANILFMPYNLLVAVVGGKTLATTIHFVNRDISLCQGKIAASISDKNVEDILLTEVSRRYPCLMDIISAHLKSINASPEDIGKQVISRDILMFFAASYLEDFLFTNKKYPQYGNKSPSMHKHCICEHILRSVFAGIFDNVGTSTSHFVMKKPASKPTLL